MRPFLAAFPRPFPDFATFSTSSQNTLYLLFPSSTVTPCFSGFRQLGGGQPRECPSCAGWLLLLGELEPDIGSRADPHQAQEIAAELRHRQVAVYRHAEDVPQHDRPGKDLKAMKAVPVGIGEDT